VWHGADDFSRRQGDGRVGAAGEQRRRGPVHRVVQTRAPCTTGWLLRRQADALPPSSRDTWAHPDARPAVREFNRIIGRCAARSKPASGDHRRAGGLCRGSCSIAGRRRSCWHSFIARESREVVPHLLWWTYVQNTHGAFGMFGKLAGAVDLPRGCSCCRLHLMFFAIAVRAVGRWCGSLRMDRPGGAIGNIVDRFQHPGSSISSTSARFGPTCSNVADACITIGVGLLVLSQLVRESALRHVVDDAEPACGSTCSPRG